MDIAHGSRTETNMWSCGVNSTVCLLTVLISVPSCLMNIPPSHIKLGSIERSRNYDYDVNVDVDSNYNYVEYKFDEEDHKSKSVQNDGNPTTGYVDANTENYTDSETWQYRKTKGYYFESNYTYNSNWKKVTTTRSLCPENTTCVRKCCPLNFTYDLSNNTCVETMDTFTPPIWDGFTYLEGINVTEHFTILDGKIVCQSGSGEARKPVTEITPFFRLHLDGNLYVENSRAIVPQLEFRTNRYCIDLFVAADGTTHINALICHVPDKNLDKHYLLSGICLTVTCCLILLKFFVLAWVPEFQTLHGLILMAYLISFLVGFLLLGLKCFLLLMHVIDGIVCVTLTLILHFFTLSAFFWRNVLCYVMWWTFREIRPLSGSSSRKRFWLYSAYAFGGPMLLTIVLSAIEFSDIPKDHPLSPRLRINCFLLGYGKLIYFLVPIMILFVINIILFTLTTLRIASIKRQNKIMLQTNDSCMQRPDTRRFILYAKLFAVMAFMEFHLLLEMIYITTLHSGSIDILHISDITTITTINALVSFIILIHFLCQKRTWRMIRKRYRQMRGLPTSLGKSPRHNLNSQLNQNIFTPMIAHH